MIFGNLIGTSGPGMRRSYVTIGLAASSCLFASAASAQTVPPLVNICAGPAVSIPVLAPVTSAIDTSVISGIVNPLLGGLTGNINSSLTDALSGRQLNASLIDAQGNLLAAGNNCSITTNTAGGIALGGGRIDGLGETGNAPATAGMANSIAIGNGASTGATANNAVALGSGAQTTVDGGVALGAGSVANRQNAANEAITGVALRSTIGTVSVGSTGNERQITNVAGGTQDTDAVNLRQLKQVQRQSNEYTDRRFEESRSYTDREVYQVRKEARQAAALGLAASSVRFDNRPGKISLGAGVGTYRGETAKSFGVGYMMPNGLASFNVTATSAGSQWGVAGGMSLTLN